MRRSRAEQTKLSRRERAAAMMKVVGIVFRTSPAALFVQLFGATLNAVLPIVTTFFAALTTTALAEAFAGNRDAANNVLEYVLITAIFGIVTTAWSTVQGYIDQIMRYRIDAAVSDSMYEHFLHLDFWRYDDKDTIDTYDKAKQFANFFPYLFSQFATIFGQVVGIVTSVIALSIVNIWIAAIVLAALVPSFIIQFKISRAQSEHWKQNVDTRRTVGMIEYNVMMPNNMAELRLYGMARHLLDLRNRLRDVDIKDRAQFERKYIFQRLAADALSAGAETAALIWTVLQIVHQAQPIGQFIYVQQLVSRVMGSAGSLINTVNGIDEDVSNLVDYQKFIDMPEAEHGHKTIRIFKENIQLTDVSFRYPTGPSDVLKGVSMTIEKGKHVAIVGENGAGKSTLIKLIAGLYAPTKGELNIDGVSLQEYSTSSWHKQLAVLQQEFLAYGFASAKDNVYYGDATQPFNKERFEKALDMAEAREFLEKLPKGVDNYVSTWMEDGADNKGIDLSGGQWQRVALARNFYRDSPIIVLDEPTSAVDALAEARIFKHIFASKDKTVITISHRLSTVKKADLIYMLKDGKVVEQGTYEQLLKAKGEFYTMFEAQM